MAKNYFESKTQEIAKKRFCWKNSKVGPIRFEISDKDHDPSKEHINQESKFSNFIRLSQAPRNTWIKQHIRKHAILLKRRPMFPRRLLKINKVKEDILCQAVQGMQLSSESLVAKGAEESSKKDTDSIEE